MQFRRAGQHGYEDLRKILGSVENLAGGSCRLACVPGTDRMRTPSVIEQVERDIRGSF